METTNTTHDSAPTIVTARLVLRAHRLEDLDECVAMWADPIVTRYIGGKPSSMQQVWMRVLGYIGHWSLLGFGYWAVEDKASRRYVGELGFADFKRGIRPDLDGVPELGWAFTSNVHGRGYATEATRAAIAWGDEHLRAPRTICMIDPENLASIRVAQKLGYAEFSRYVHNGESSILADRVR